MNERARPCGLRIDQGGPVQMPTLLFADDPEWTRGFAFCAETLRHGAYLHPKHNMVLSCAHTADDIGRVLDAVDAGFRHVAHRDAACDGHALGRHARPAQRGPFP